MIIACIYFVMIRIMHVLCTGNNYCVAKYNFPLTMFETDNKGIFIYRFSCFFNSNSYREFMFKYVNIWYFKSNSCITTLVALLKGISSYRNRLSFES